MSRDESNNFKTASNVSNVCKVKLLVKVVESWQTFVCIKKCRERKKGEEEMGVRATRARSSVSESNCTGRRGVRSCSTWPQDWILSPTFPHEAPASHAKPSRQAASSPFVRSILISPVYTYIPAHEKETTTAVRGLFLTPQCYLAVSLPPRHHKQQQQHRRQ